MGDRIGLTVLVAGRDERIGHLLEEVLDPELVLPLGLVPGSAVPGAVLVGGYVAVPGVPVAAQIGGRGYAHVHGVDEELVHVAQCLGVEHELAGFGVDHLAAEALVELPVVGAVADARREAHALGHDTFVLHSLDVVEHVVKRVIARRDAIAQAVDLVLGIADRGEMCAGHEEGAGFSILRNAPDQAVIARDVDQVVVDLAERPGVEIDPVLDRAQDAGLRPCADVFVPGHDDVRRRAGLCGQRHRLLEVFPAAPDLGLDRDVEVLALDPGLLFEIVGGHGNGVDTVVRVVAGPA